MPLFIYAFLFTLNAVKICWGETFYLRDLKLYDHSMFQNRISIPIWVSLNQWNGCHLKFEWYSPFPKSLQVLCYIVIQAMAMVSMNQIKKKAEIINLWNLYLIEKVIRNYKRWQFYEVWQLDHVISMNKTMYKNQTCALCNVKVRCCLCANPSCIGVIRKPVTF